MALSGAGERRDRAGARFHGERRPRGPDFAARYLLGNLFDNSTAICLAPGFAESALRDAGFTVEGTEIMLDGITMLTRARTP